MMKPNMFAPKKTRAQAMVEFAIVLPLLLLLLYGILEAGRLLFMYSTIVTATRQASRYGSATGEGLTPGGPRYQDCAGIRLAAQRVDFLNSFEDSDILIEYDSGPGSGITDTCDGSADSGVTPSTNNDTRIVVTVDGNFFPIVPRLVPFIERSVANGNPISATSARTIIVAISIVVTPPPGSGVPTAGTNQLALSMTASPTTYAFAGETINFTYTATNNGTVELTGLALTPTHGVISGCDATTLAPGASTTCYGSYVTTGTDVTNGSISAQATATASDGTNTITSNTATVTVTWEVRPELGLSKSASTEYATTGGVIVYTFAMTNTGNTPLTGITISDPLLGSPVAGCGGDLAVGATGTCTASYTVTSQDIGDDQLVNTATATGTYNTQTVTSNTASATVWTGPLFLRASALPESASAAGQTITYTYEIINNTGTALYPPYTVSGHRGTENCSPNPGGLPAGASFACSGTYTVQQSDLDSQPSLVNNVTVTACTASNNCNGPKLVTSNSDRVTLTLNRTPALSMIIVSAGPNPSTTLGAVLNYTYAVTNTGNVTLTPSIVDTKVTNASCTGSLAPGGSYNCTGTYTVTQADLDAGSITNLATAMATFNSQQVSSASQSVTVITYPGPRSRLSITPNPTSFTGVGQFIVYTYTVTNTGDRPLIGPYIVSDSKVTFVDCAPATSPLGIGASTNCVGAYATTQADVDLGHIINSANITASDGTQAIISNSAMAVVYVPGAPTITPSPTNTAPPTATSTATSTPTATATTPVCTAIPVTLTASADSWIDENSPTTNNGSTTTLSVQSRNNRDNRALVQFSLPSLPAGCVIQSATLRLNASTAANGRTLQALRVTNVWTETGVTWNNQPTTTGTAATVSSGTGWREWNVTSIVQAMYSSTNNGFLIRDASEDAGGTGSQQVFSSRENSTNKPELLITYTQAP